MLVQYQRIWYKDGKDKMSIKTRAVATTLLVVLLVFCAAPALSIAQSEGWVIKGNTVYIDDVNVYLSATPHTLGSSGWVEFELMSKGYEGEIDAVWGFNLADGIKPSQPQIWAKNIPHTKYRLVDIEKEGTLTVTGITSFTKLDWATFVGDPDIGNRNNIHLYEVTADFWGMGEPETLVVAFNSYILNGDTATITYNYDTREREYYIEYYDDWKSFDTSNFTQVSHSYKGCDDWRFVKLDASIQKDITYKVRCWVEIPFAGQDAVSGKYIWAVKPHSESIQDAIANGHLYLLDPWYNANWPYRLEVTIDHTKVDEDLVDFPVLITEEDMTATFWAQVQADGEDIVVTSSDGETKLKRELVSIDTVGETMELWFKAPTLSSTIDDIFYLYFGNAGATEVNDADTWDTNFMAVYHMNDDPDNAQIVDSTGNDNDGSKGVAGEPEEVDGLVGRAQEFDGLNDQIAAANSASLNISGAITLEAILNCEGDTTLQQYFIHKGTAATIGYLVHVNTNRTITFWIFSIASYDTITSTATITYGIPSRVIATWIPSTSISIQIDDTLKSGAADETAIEDSSAYFLRLGQRSDSPNRPYYGIEDEVRISDIARTAGWIGTTYNTESSPATFYSISGEAIAVPTVETDNAEVDGTSAILNGEITDDGYPDGGPVDIRGFVWDDATSHADPGNTAPGASAYSDNWTEAGSFGEEAFDHEATGLTALVTYYYRACAHNDAGWSYGDELTFFALVDGKVYLEFRPDLDETRIRGNLGIPTGIRIGEPGEGLFTGYSLPIWNSNDEELYFLNCVPDRWDGESHIIIHIKTALANANESGNSYQLQVQWEHVTPNVEEVPVTLNVTTFTRTVESNTQFECYQDYFIVLYNADVGDDILVDDEIAFRLRRNSVVGLQLKDLDGELIIVHWGILYARGDLLGSPDSILTEEDITSGEVVGGIDMMFLGLILLACFLTWFSYRGRFLPLSLAAALGWIALGIVLLTSPDSVNLDPISSTWVQPLGFVFFLMALVVLLFQTRTDIRHERSVRGSSGGTSESWHESVPKRKKKPTAAERQADYKEQLRGKTGRK